LVLGGAVRRLLRGENRCISIAFGAGENVVVVTGNAGNSKSPIDTSRDILSTSSHLIAGRLLRPVGLGLRVVGQGHGGQGEDEEGLGRGKGGADAVGENNLVIADQIKE